MPTWGSLHPSLRPDAASSPLPTILLPHRPASPLPSLAPSVPVATDAVRCWGFPSQCAWNSQPLSRGLLPAASQDTHHPLLLAAPSLGAAAWMLALQLGSATPCRSSLLFGLLSVSQPLPSPAGYPPAPQINGIHLGTLHRLPHPNALPPCVPPSPACWTLSSLAQVRSFRRRLVAPRDCSPQWARAAGLVAVPVWL